MNGLKTRQSKRAKNIIFWTSEYYYVDFYSSVMLFQIFVLILCTLNPLTPNDTYSGRTAPLTSKVAFYIFIQQI